MALMLRRSPEQRVKIGHGWLTIKRVTDSWVSFSWKLGLAETLEPVRLRTLHRVPLMDDTFLEYIRNVDGQAELRISAPMSVKIVKEENLSDDEK